MSVSRRCPAGPIASEGAAPSSWGLHSGVNVFEQGQRVRISAAGLPEFANVRHCIPGPDGGWTV